MDSNNDRIRNLLAERRKELGYTMKELAQLVGVSEATVSRWESGDIANMRRDRIAKLAKALQISPAVIMDWDGDKPSPPVFAAEETAVIRVPVFGKIPAGAPLEAIEDILGYEEMSAKLADSTKEYFALEIDGDSMYPKYMDGDIVIFERQSDCESGEDCAVRIDGNDATFKKIRKKQFGITLQPINPEYEPIHVEYGDPDQPIEVLGVAKEIRRKV